MLDALRSYKTLCIIRYWRHLNPIVNKSHNIITWWHISFILISAFGPDTVAGLNNSLNFSATLTSETLSSLNISIERLPQKCQQLLRQAAEAQLSQDIEEIDPIAISLRQSRETLQKLDEECEILKLRQKNVQLQARIDRNKKFLGDLRQELLSSKESLERQNPNPDSIKAFNRELKQKVVSYHESCDKAMAQFTKLSVPDAILPTSLHELLTSVESLREQAAALKLQADEVELARDAKKALNMLRS